MIRLNNSLKDDVKMIFITQIELGETRQLLASLTRLHYQQVKGIISEIFQYFLVEWRSVSTLCLIVNIHDQCRSRSESGSGQIWYPKHLLLDIIPERFQDNAPNQVIHFLGFVSHFIGMNPGMHTHLCIPAISDIILGFCLRYFIPNAFSLLDDAHIAHKDKDTLFYKLCRSVLDVLIGGIDRTDIVHDVWPFTVQLVEVRIPYFFCNLYSDIK
jgi:hypothetical protein